MFLYFVWKNMCIQKNILMPKNPASKKIKITLLRGETGGKVGTMVFWTSMDRRAFWVRDS